MKNWSKFYDYSFRKQFIKDLSTMKNIDDIKWFFNSTSGINDISELKTMVVNALTKNNNPIKELNELFKDPKIVTKFKKIFDDDMITKPQDLLNKLQNDKIFEKIFEIVE